MADCRRQYLSRDWFKRLPRLFVISCDHWNMYYSLKYIISNTICQRLLCIKIVHRTNIYTVKCQLQKRTFRIFRKILNVSTCRGRIWIVRGWYFSFKPPQDRPLMFLATMKSTRTYLSRNCQICFLFLGFCTSAGKNGTNTMTLLPVYQTKLFFPRTTKGTLNYISRCLNYVSTGWCRSVIIVL